MLLLWYISFTASTTIWGVQSANILAILPLHVASHFKVLQPLLEKLAEKGHQVDVLSHFPRQTPLPGYTDFNLSGTIPALSNVPLESVQSLTFFQRLQFMYDKCGRSVCRAVPKAKIVKELMKSNKSYDAIILEMFLTDCLLGYANIFHVPLIAVTTSVNLPWASDLIGLPDNPSYIPNYYTEYTQDMSFIERIYNAITLHATKIWYTYFVLEESNGFVEEIFGKNDIHLRDILKNISLLMVNSHFSIQQSRPMTSNFIEIGGLHIKPKMLSKDIEKHLTTDLQGVAFLSFGSYLNSDSFPVKYMSILFEALGEIPYKILWKGDANAIPKHLKIPQNIRFISWVPQLELLCHPNLKFFITHCGLASIQESIYCGKPILGIPVWVDQFMNANTAVSKGVGLSIPFTELTKQKLSDTLKELIENPKYAMNAKRLSELFRDRPMSPLDTAVYWTEYVIRHKGAPHLRSKAADLPWYQYYCVDMIFILSIAIVVLLMCVYKLLTILICKACTYIHYRILSTKSKEKVQ